MLLFRLLFRFIVASLTLAIGLGCSLVPQRSMPFFLSLAFFLLMPIVSISMVIYQGAYLRKAWRPAIGKAFLAVLLWLFPSPFFLLCTLFVWLDPPAVRSSFAETITVELVPLLLTAAYGAIGLSLCCWVKRYELGDHWLLRNSDKI
jgi:hypothetical protein